MHRAEPASAATPLESARQPAQFADFIDGLLSQSPLRQAVTRACRRAEPECVGALIDQARLAPAQAEAAHALAVKLALDLRARGGAGGKQSLVQGLIQQFALSSQEGVALMCLAEALLRIPDNATRDALIRDKIGDADWRSHIGQSPSVFVNAATWGLLLTGKLVATHAEGGLARALTRALGKGGEPIVRSGVDMAMRLMGEQFVAGEDIGEALKNARRRESEGFRHSYDMLGEAALTDADAQHYLASYVAAIHAIGESAAGRGIYLGPGISIKLSALHSRYNRAHHARVMGELYPRLLKLTELARRYDIGLNIDAEESDRLEISLDLLQRLCFEPVLEGWNGVGFVIQAYQKRCPFVIDELIDLARRSRRRLMLRLVKGAYWDSEIKRAQVDGLIDYPVYTRKAHTDVSYLACARKLLAFPAEIYPQFATHNAYTLAAIHQMAGDGHDPTQYEFQCLHGMGEPLYRKVVAAKDDGGLAQACRIYAPVGTHQTLLAYLVRRLLENGANTSFVNRVADASIPIGELVADPVATVEEMAAPTGIIGLPHPMIVLPRALFGHSRANSRGVDLADEQRLAQLASNLVNSPPSWQAAPLIDGVARMGNGTRPLLAPADLQHVGDVREADANDVDDALAIAVATFPHWQATPASQRSDILLCAADRIEVDMDRLCGLIVREAGKTFANAVGEVREAVDFLRYYALQARNELSSGRDQPLGVVVCISPWNFPLAIFTGQIAAALAAGNTVIAKPAEQTPLIAMQAVQHLLACGIPGGALQMLPGRGETIGAALVADPRVRGVVFTGSNVVARALQRSLAGRIDGHGQPAVLIAETGGQNAMIVDSSALTEQVVSDAIVSAFDSAGQRCSALRVLCIQEDVAERVLTMLRGTMQELQLGVPQRLSTDVGPLIDADARQGVQAHIDAMRAAGRRVYQAPVDRGAEALRSDHFIAPTLIEIERIDQLRHEVFGPVLHVLRFRRDQLGNLVDAINATGYGLTMGVHSRIDETIEFVIARAHVGNIYVNRNMIGAVVGVQPFGGDGLSGTGPKAGGPRYLRRLLARPAQGGDHWSPVHTASDVTMPAGATRPTATEHLAALHDLRAWAAASSQDRDLAPVMDAIADHREIGRVQALPGPTGESNSYFLMPRRAVLCVAQTRGDLLLQFATVLAADGAAVWIESEMTRRLHEELSPALQAHATFGDPDHCALDAALIAADRDGVCAMGVRLAQRAGSIVSLQSAEPGARSVSAYAPELLMAERAVSVNTAAAGGNASLMTIG